MANFFMAFSFDATPRGVGRLRGKERWDEMMQSGTCQRCHLPVPRRGGFDPDQLGSGFLRRQGRLQASEQPGLKSGSAADDPNLTGEKLPGNPTQSYRSREPLRIVGGVAAWEGHSPERLKQMKDRLARLKEQGVEATD